MKKFIKALISVIFIFIIISQIFINVSAVTIGSTEYDFYFYKKGIGLSNYKGDGGFVSIPATYKVFDLLRIDVQAFYNKSSVTGVEIPNTVTTLGDRVFEKCENLKIVIISDSVTTFGHYMFLNCFNLEDVVIGKGITSIPYQTFGNCKKLRNLTIPESVASINEFEFLECPNLTIYGYVDSYAEYYAKQYKIRFVSIDEIPQQTSSDTLSSTQSETPVLSNETIDTMSSNSSSVVSNKLSSSQSSITRSENKVSSSNKNVSSDSSNAESKEISLEATKRKNKTDWIYNTVIIITIILVGGGIGLFVIRKRNQNEKGRKNPEK